MDARDCGRSGDSWGAMRWSGEPGERARGLVDETGSGVGVGDEAELGHGGSSGGLGREILAPHQTGLGLGQ